MLEPRTANPDIAGLGVSLDPGSPILALLDANNLPRSSSHLRCKVEYLLLLPQCWPG